MEYLFQPHAWTVEYIYIIYFSLKMAQKTFSGCRINSFFVKVNKPQLEPLLLKSHDGEVTTVDWCPSEMGKVATASDDFTVQFWNIQAVATRTQDLLLPFKEE